MKEVLTELSVIKIIQTFQDALRTAKLPFPPETFVIQQDAYARLGNDDHDPENPIRDAIGSYDYMKKEKDGDMRFSVDFYELGAVLFIDHLGPVQFTYPDIAKTEKEIAKQLISFIHMASNGQIGVLVTNKRGKPCAVELLLDLPDDTQKSVGTNALYAWWWPTKERDTSYSCTHYANHLDAVHLDLPEQFFLCQYKPDGTIGNPGRVFTHKQFTPITKYAFGMLERESVWAGTEKKATESDWIFLYKSWEFWVLMVSFIAIFFGVDALGYIPKFVMDSPQLTWPISIFLVYKYLVPALKRKPMLRVEHPDHPYVIVDAYVTRFFGVLNPWKKYEKHQKTLSERGKTFEKMKKVELVAWFTVALIQLISIPLFYAKLSLDNVRLTNFNLYILIVIVASLALSLPIYIHIWKRTNGEWQLFAALISFVLSIAVPAVLLNNDSHPETHMSPYIAPSFAAFALIVSYFVFIYGANVKRIRALKGMGIAD